MKKRHQAVVSRSSNRKARRTFTLSIQSVNLLDELRDESEGAARSASAVLDGILRDISLERRRLEIDRAVTDYYNNLTEGEAEEQRAWGRFAIQQFAKREK